MPRYASRLVLAVSAANADAILSGKRAVDVRKIPPRRLPARAYLAVAGTGAIAGECVLGEPVGEGPDGTLLPVSEPRPYRRPKALADFGLKKVPRSFRYVS
jgi:predicted transcriptional regulator